MILHHYSGRTNTASLWERGIVYGEVPLTHKNYTVNCPWFTPSHNVNGKGLYSDYAKSLIKIRVRFPAGTKRLARWLPHGQRHLPDIFLHGFIACGGGTFEASQWYFYRGTVPSSWFIDIVDLQNGEELTREDVAGEPVTRDRWDQVGARYFDHHGVEITQSYIAERRKDHE